jgi:hypothetical protein
LSGQEIRNRGRGIEEKREKAISSYK